MANEQLRTIVVQEKGSGEKQTINEADFDPTRHSRIADETTGRNVLDPQSTSDTRTSAARTNKRSDEVGATEVEEQNRRAQLKSHDEGGQSGEGQSSGASGNGSSGNGQ